MKLLVVFCFVVAALAERARFDFYKVHRVVPYNRYQLDALWHLISSNRFRFWTEPSGIHKSVDIMVAPDKRTEFNEFIRRNNMEDKILIENVQGLIDEEQSAIRSSGSSSGGMNWTKYNTLEEIEAWMEDLSKTYNNVQTIVAGKTYENRDIKGIEITFGTGFKTVVFESNIHAREWITAAATSWVVNEILKSPEDSICRKFNYIYIPVSNPDGYVYTWTNDRLWRKTRSLQENDLLPCYGADPNRNWDFHWNEVGASSFPCSEIYAGPKAFSEVETKTLSEFFRKNAAAKKMDLYIAFHSYSQLLMYPWGYTSKPAPLSDTWKRIGDIAAKDLQKVNGVKFQVGDIYHTVYPVSGSSLEWFYNSFNSTISFVYELRDDGTYGFILPPRYIIPSGKELYASIMGILTEYVKLPPKHW